MPRFIQSMALLIRRKHARLTPFVPRRYLTPLALEHDGEPTKQPIRANDVGIQMLSQSLHHQLFGGRQTRAVQPEQRLESEQALKAHGLWGKPTDRMPPIDFVLPPLLGKTIEAHFQTIGKKTAEPYLEQVQSLVTNLLPPMPTTWQRRAGWVRYDSKHPEGIAVAGPLEPALVFDTEVCMSAGQYPTMATAASPNAWYAWTSPALLDRSEPQSLISMPFDRPRILVGHNVSFDRAKILEEYSIEGTLNRFVDTMSLHTTIAGLTSQQRGLWLKAKRAAAAAEEQEESESVVDDSLLASEPEHHDNTKPWMSAGSTNSLSEVYYFHCHKRLDKSSRDVFFTGTLDDVDQQFQELMTYCAKDVHATHQVLRIAFPQFLKKCPHPVTFSGMLEMSTCYLPVNEGWTRYIQRAESKYEELSSSLQSRLRELAEQALEAGKNGKAQTDPWLKNLDWTTLPQKFTKPKFKKDGTYAKNGEPRPLSNQRMPGYPEWFKELCPSGATTPHVTTRTRITPYLLKLQWQGKYPLRYDFSGWGYVVPNSDTVHHSNLPPQPLPNEDAKYFPLPHKDGPEARCGNPLAKDYVSAIQTGLLTSQYPEAREALEMNASCAYWISCRRRVKDQMVVWSDQVVNGDRLGAIIPQVVPAGTVTRRAVEPTWMTASNPKKNLIGSELKAQVCAPPGWRFVGADVDSQELWISALIGDSSFGFHGATPFGWMTLQGRKSDGTDLHSKSASILGISRDQAKVFNYGRIYGAGESYAVQLLRQFNKTMDEQTAKQRASALYLSTKGVRKYLLTDTGEELSREEYFQYLNASKRRKSKNNVKVMWKGGSESFMFNQLETIAVSDDPRTPALGCAISDALKPGIVKTEYMTSRINWVVQSSGVDYLHMLLVSMRWLLSQYKIPGARFIISIHDEVRYICQEEDALRVALALQISNLWTRTMFASRLGINDLPQSVAFFSAVDIDTVIRKEVTLDCVTLSSPDAIPPGRQVDIYTTLQETKNGRL